MKKLVFIPILFLFSCGPTKSYYLEDDRNTDLNIKVYHRLVVERKTEKILEYYRDTLYIDPEYVTTHIIKN